MTGLYPDLRPDDVAALRTGPVLVTGTAGFIGFAVADALLSAGVEVVGIDCLAGLYTPLALKQARHAALRAHEGWHGYEADLCEPGVLEAIFARHGPTHVLHLAAHAAVLPSFDRPLDYVQGNVIGTQRLLEAVCRSDRVAHLVYASTSSVYGKSKDNATPFHEGMRTDTPISVYGASKIANEAMMQVYAEHYGLAVTGLRFFKVYGPWSRADTVFFKFTDRIWRGLPVRLHNFGDIYHAFTYIDDVVAGCIAALARPEPLGDDAPHRVYNIGNPNSQHLGDCLDLIEAALGREAKREFVDLPAGDRTFSRADVSRAERDLGYSVSVQVGVGIPRFVAWYGDVYVPIAERAGLHGAAAGVA